MTLRFTHQPPFSCRTGKKLYEAQRFSVYNDFEETMSFYSIYVEISHLNQLNKLRPTLIGTIRFELNELVRRFGGRSVNEDLFRYPPVFDTTARKTAEAAVAMYACIRENDKDLFGATLLITSVPEEIDANRLELLVLTVPENNCLWVDSKLVDEFNDCLIGEFVGGFFRVDGLKEIGPKPYERLSRLLVRPDRLRAVRRVLQKLEKEDNDFNTLLLRGEWGSGKRATLHKALDCLYPENGGTALTIPLYESAGDPMEPLVRTLRISFANLPEYLDREEAEWWAKTGSEVLKLAQKGGLWEISDDQLPVDLIQTFALYIKAHIERQSGKPVYILIDGFDPDTESALWLRSLFVELFTKQSFRLVFIYDSDEFKKKVALPGKGYEVAFRQPSENEMTSILRASNVRSTPREVTRWLKKCGANLYKLFYLITEKEGGMGRAGIPGEALVASLNDEQRKMLFLIHAAAGLCDRDLLIERQGENLRGENLACYSHLQNFGLIREYSDGRVQESFGIPANAISQNAEILREAESFGAYLYKKCQNGYSINLLRLFRYLERWGPIERAIDTLRQLSNYLLTNRRLRTAGQLLTSSIMSASELNAAQMESLQNVICAARLRYILLSCDVDEAKSQVKDGSVSLICGKGLYSEEFKLQIARYYYAIGQQEDALSASKEALFAFQKLGNHRGETYSHLELALTLLASGKIRDAIDHFGIAKRIGMQVDVSWGVIRAAAMETIGHFLFGDIPRAMRLCHECREMAYRNGRRDLHLLLTLVAVRIDWELGRYREVGKLAGDGQRVADFYGLTNESEVFKVWRGRSLLADSREEGEGMLLGSRNPREAYAYLAEAAFLIGDVETAREHIERARALERRSSHLQGEYDDWSDGYFPIEGRLSDSVGPLDVLGEWIEAFGIYISKEGGSLDRVMRLRALASRRRAPTPYAYLYLLWAALISPETEEDWRIRFISQAYSQVQLSANRFYDYQAKHAWLTANPWNRRLMEEARKRNFA